MTTEKIQTKAKAFGTFNSPTTGAILYVDPKHDDEAHHSPKLTQAEADMAFERGLIEDPKGAKAVDEGDDELHDENALSTVAGERVAEFAKIDHDAAGAAPALDSRSTTAFSDRERVEGGAEGYTDGVRADDSMDDAPPAPRAAPRKPAKG